MKSELRLDSLVRAELERRRGDWPRIATEADVSYSWLSKFVNEHIDNPGYETLRRLHTYLRSSKAKAAA